MTKQELEKAIENGESVWFVAGNNVYEFKLKNHTNRFINKIGNEEMYNYTDENGTDRCFLIKALYKTKAEAEHYLHHANITHSEQLPFVTWEEFLKEKEIEFTDKNKVLTWLYIVDNKTPNIQLENRFEKLKMWDLTEDNFYKAYDECVRLFRGEG